MALLDGYRKVLGGFRRRPRLDTRAEIEAHLAMKAAELVESGLGPDEAAAEARRRFGRVDRIENECRDLQQQIRRRESVAAQIDGVIADVRFALRSLRRRPGFTAFAVSTLALGIGGATTIFSVANGMFLKPLPGVRDADRIVELTQGYEGDFVSVSYPVFRALSDGVEEFDAVAGLELLTVAIGDGSDAPLVTIGLQATDGYFETLGTRPALGRLFTRDEASYPDPADVVVLGHDLWERRFMADPEVIGSTIRINGTPMRVIGVTEAGFHGHAAAIQFEVFVPVGVAVPGVHTPASIEGPRNGMFDMIARLAPGVTPEQAIAAADAHSDRFIQSLEGADATYPLRIFSYGALPGSVRYGVAAFLGVLLLVVSLVLAITCVNITNLQLSRAAQREREIAVRISLGAGKARIARQLLTESLVLFALGALFAVALASGAGALVGRLQNALPLPGARVLLDLSIDMRVLLFALLITAMAGVVSGLVPGWYATRRDPVAGLRSGDPTRGGRQRARSILVAAQVAATVVLLVVAGLFLRSFRASQQIDLGFDSTNVFVATFDMELAGYDQDRGQLFWATLLERVGALPEVEVVSLAHKLPISSRSQWSINAPGVEPPEGTYGFLLSNRRVSTDYFETLGFRVVRGRGFTDADAVGAPNVVVLNETMVERLWPGEDPIGRVIDNGRDQLTVVGVAADAVYHDPYEPTPGFGFLPLKQNYNQQMVVHARMRTADSASIRRLQETLRDLDPLAPVMSFARLDDQLMFQFLGDLLGAALSASFGGVGLALALLGVYGVTSFWTAQRRGEIGIRLALGATGESVVRWAVLRGLVAPSIGMLVGLMAAAAVSGLLGSILSGVPGLDPVTFGTVAVFLSVAGLVATWLPARAAARVPPADTLRAQ